MLSDSPPERDLEWSDTGVQGVWRYVNRLWRIITEPGSPVAEIGSPKAPEFGGVAMKLRRSTHRAIADVTTYLDDFQYNRAVATVHELSNAILEFTAAIGDKTEAGAAWAHRESLEMLTRLISPLLPHLAEEAWQKLGHEHLLADAPWPSHEAALVIEDSVTVAVQVNGKLRATLDIARDSVDTEVEAAALALPGVQKAMDGRVVRKVIVVANRIVNIVLDKAA